MYEITISQRLPGQGYSDRLVGVFKSFEEIMPFMTIMEKHFRIEDVSIKPVVTEEIEEVE